MQFNRLTNETCHEAGGVVIVIDVIRAFTVAAYALASGAEDITLVGTVEEALGLRERMPDALVMGEVGGLRPDGFDLGNSPAAVATLDLCGRHLVQRTSAGTQGVVRSSGADVLLACSLCCATATARYVQSLAPQAVTFVITGIWPGSDEANSGDEDVACADFVETLLRGQVPDRDEAVRRVLDSYVARKRFLPPDSRLPAGDLDYCTAVDHVDFAMPVRREGGRLVLRRGEDH